MRLVYDQREGDLTSSGDKNGTILTELFIQCSVLCKLCLKVIVTSWLFPSGKFSLERLQQLSSLIGKEQLVIDLSCRRQKNSWFVAINKWQTVTSLEITKGEKKKKKPIRYMSAA